MKKIIAFLMMFALMLVLAVSVSAETSTDIPEGSETIETENSTPETESATESEISGEEMTISEKIVEYIKENTEEIIVLVVTAFVGILTARLRNKMNGDLTTLNNNAIAMAANSTGAVNKALAEVKDVANVVTNYKNEIVTLLNEIRKSAEEKKSLENTLSHVETFLKTAKLATLELAAEVADLLLLANIPVSKKEEMYSHHCAAVKAISEAETTEVKENVEKA